MFRNRISVLVLKNLCVFCFLDCKMVAMCELFGSSWRREFFLGEVELTQASTLSSEGEEQLKAHTLWLLHQEA